MATARKRGNSWTLIAYLGYDDATKRQKTKTQTIDANGITKAEALRQAAAFEDECVKNKNVNDKNMPLSKFIEYWQKEHADKTYEAKTRERNKVLIRRINDALGNIRLCKIQPKHLLAFYSALREAKRLDGKKGTLSDRTIQMHHKLLSSILGKAVKWKFITENPCSNVDAPKAKSKKVNIYEPADLERFFKALYAKAKVKYQLFFSLAQATGMRRSEILGLRWSDVDFDTKTLFVDQVAVQVEKVGIVYKEPKTEQSARKISFSSVVDNLLKQHQAIQEIERQAAKRKDRWTETGLIFATDEGKQMWPSSFQHWLQKFCDKENLPRVCIHAFRHMSTSYAIASGHDLKSVQARGGWNQMSTMTEIYGHALPAKDREIAESADDLLQTFRPKDKETDTPKTFKFRRVSFIFAKNKGQK